MVRLLQRLACKGGKDERCPVDFLVVVLAQLLFLRGGPAAERFPEVRVGVLGADHKANLARGVSRDGGIGIFDSGEDLSAVLLELGDERKVQPLVLGCAKNQ